MNSIDHPTQGSQHQHIEIERVPLRRAFFFTREEHQLEQFRIPEEQLTPEIREVYRRIGIDLINKGLAFLVSFGFEWAEDGYQAALDLLNDEVAFSREIDDGSCKVFRDNYWTDAQRAANKIEFEEEMHRVAVSRGESDEQW